MISQAVILLLTQDSGSRPVGSCQNQQDESVIALAQVW